MSRTKIRREEVALLPPCLDDFISKDNDVRALDFFVEHLDLEKLGFELKGKGPVGRPLEYSGKDLLKLLIYGYLNQIRSSRKLEAETTRNLEVIWLLENQRPRYWTINQFRKDNCEAFKNVLRKFHRVCEKLELFGKELIAIDGAFFKARNNSSRNFTQAKLGKMGEKIDSAIEAYNQALEDECDEPAAAEKEERPSSEEDSVAETGDEHDGKNDLVEVSEGGTPSKKGEHSKSVKGRKGQGKLEELKEKKARIERLKTKAAQGPSGQVSLTDEDSRLLKKSGQCLVGHNVQGAFDSKHHLLVDLDIVQAGGDANQLHPMAEAACEALDIAPSPEKPIDCLVDGGYYNTAQMQRCEEQGIRVYIPSIKKSITHEAGFGIEDFTYKEDSDEFICPEGKSLSRHTDQKSRGVTYQIYYNPAACRDCPVLKRCTRAKYRKLQINPYRESEQKIASRMREEPEKYAKRKEIVEHPFGTMKSVWGYAQFMVTGHKGCKGELSLIGFSYNWKRAMKIVGMERLMEGIVLMPIEIWPGGALPQPSPSKNRFWCPLTNILPKITVVSRFTSLIS